MSIFQILYHSEISKNDFSKISPINTNGSNFTNYNFFDTEKLVDWYYNHSINKYLDFWILQAIKPQKTVFLPIFTSFTSGYWWILTKIWFFNFFYPYLHKSTTGKHTLSLFWKKKLYHTPLLVCRYIWYIYTALPKWP